ncbi:MAG: hypothetical protein ACE5ID_02390 [Acidobacteriota bacterium]
MLSTLHGRSWISTFCAFVALARPLLVFINTEIRVVRGGILPRLDDAVQVLILNGGREPGVWAFHGRWTGSPVCGVYRWIGPRSEE